MGTGFGHCFMSNIDMSATRSSLLSQVRDLQDAEGWKAFDSLYRPLLTEYAMQRGLRRDAAEEVAQQSMAAVVHAIPRFRRQKSFRAWLRKLVNHKVSDYLSRERRQRQADTQVWEQLSDGEPAPAQLWQRRWNEAHVRYVIDKLRGELAEHTLRAFELYVVQECPVEEISAILGMTANQIYVAKSRVLSRLRNGHLADMLDSLYEVEP